MKEINFFAKGEITNSIEVVRKLLECGIFSSENSRHPLFKSAFIEMLIELRNFMYHCDNVGERISFTDDVNIDASKKIHDVTDVIKYVRDALCHPDSDNHYIEKGNIKSTFNVCFGKANLLETSEFKQGSEYEDDICFFLAPKTSI
ncbi:hypothetical protein [Ignatzschineria indica]|uniref:hypothetical protein n=1 Tax=Ignatzschineria indica TaxID=472583 RepID=UPI003637116F